MSKNNIQLSICIPTFDREDYLRQTLESICSQDVFKDTFYVEIIISDNNSTDGTKDLCDEYIAIHGDKIKYYHISESIFPDENHFNALKRGNGKLLKLSNDTLVHKPGSLIKILNLIDDSMQSRKTLFFLNGRKFFKKNLHCDGIEDLVVGCSFWTTWIGGFSIWRDQFWEINDFFRYSSLKLVHVDVLFRMVSLNGAVVCNDKLFDVLSVENKVHDYNLFELFIKNYSYILSEYLQNDLISVRVIKNEKRKVLFKLICPWVAKSSQNTKSNFNIDLHLEQVKIYFSEKKIIFSYFICLKFYTMGVILLNFYKKLLN